MKCILLNGPPRSGKDTAALAIEDYLYRVRPNTFPTHEKFSRPCKLAFAGMMNRTVDDNFNVDYYEEHKEETIPELGVSFRKWQQDWAEKFMKPRYGDDVFVQLFLGRNERAIKKSEDNVFDDIVIVSDCGFQVEPDTLDVAKKFTEIIVLHIHRPHHNFGNDTRSWILPRGRAINVQNDSTLEHFQTKCVMVVKEWLDAKAHN